MSQSKTLNTVSIGKAADLIETIITDGIKRGMTPANTMMHGSPGLGKSAIVKQIGNKLHTKFNREVELIDLRLSAMESSDVQGIPYNAKTGRVVDVKSWDEEGNPEVNTVEEQEMFFSTPAWWPKDPNKIYILFLDELTNCPIHVQHAAYRLILDRSIQNGKELPPNVAIVAAGNLKKDKTGARDLAPAAANRFACHLMIDSEAATESFLDYAMNAGFDETIIGFLNWKSENVYSDADERTSSPAWASPRSWEFADGHLKNESLRASPDNLEIVLAGTVGSGMAGQLSGYMEYQKVLPDWTKVRSGKDKYKVPQDEDQVKFAVSTALAFQVRDAIAKEKEGKADVSEIDNLVNVLKQVPDEHKIVFFKTLRRDFDAVMAMVDYQSLYEEFQPVSARLHNRK